MKIKEIVSTLEDYAPLSMQESYDNSGLIAGSDDDQVNSVLLSVDVTEKVIDEAVRRDAGLVISHHPLVFSPLKRITNRSRVERLLMKALRNNIALYAAHTNFDNAARGVNEFICRKLGLKDLQIVSPAAQKLRKLVVFVPSDHADSVRKAIFGAGAGQIGEYDQCSFNLQGEGTFRPSDEASPFTGEKGQMHTEREIRVETIYPFYIEEKVLGAMFESHPYEEVAYDIYPVENKFGEWGMGMTGRMEEPSEEMEFLKTLKEVFSSPVIKHTGLLGGKVEKVAVCGGSGSTLLENAISVGADVFVSADFKYHQFFDADGRIVIADVGHFESEQFTVELFYDILTKKFPKFAVYQTEVNTNPINYL